MISSRAAGTSAPRSYEMYEPVQNSEAEDLLGPFPKCDDSHGGIQQWRQEFNSGYSGSPVVAATFKENSRPQSVGAYFNPFCCHLLIHLSWWMWKSSQFHTQGSWGIAKPEEHTLGRPGSGDAALSSSSLGAAVLCAAPHLFHDDKQVKAMLFWVIQDTL